MLFEVISVLGTTVAIVALVLYITDRIKVEPVILQTYVDKASKPNEYIIQVNISNEGAKKADNCDVVIEIGGNIVEYLDYVPVDGPKGRIGVDWPKEKKYPLYPRRPMWVRGYITAEPNTPIVVILRVDSREISRQPFSLPKISN